MKKFFRDLKVWIHCVWEGHKSAYCPDEKFGIWNKCCDTCGWPNKTIKREINFNEYQELAHTTAVYPRKDGLAYLTLGLTGEAGEIANKVAKIFRDDDGTISEIKKKDLLKECGDLTWFLAEFTRLLGGDFQTIAQENLDKLLSRKQRGKLRGSGDLR